MTEFKDKFEYPVLTKTHGRLNYTILKEIKDQLKANTAAIYSDLGGSAHGHLDLVITPEEYALVSVIPYVQHLHPGKLDIPIGSTQHTALHLCKEHKECCCLFQEMVDLKKLLIK